jgi:hypothetical protein
VAWPHRPANGALGSGCCFIVVVGGVVIVVVVIVVVVVVCVAVGSDVPEG